MTTGQGRPIADDDNTPTVGDQGPIQSLDFQLDAAQAR